jgi:gliding motility-associated-like protein
MIVLCSFLKAQQSPTICPINAGPDQTICAPNCANLSGTFVPTATTTSYATSTIPYAPDPFNVGTQLFLGDDQWSSIIPLPFTFCFYGNSYTQLIIGSNGVISFTTAGPSNTPGGYCQWPISAAVPTASDPMNAVMGPWQDLYLPGGGQLRYSTYGASPCRRFVVSWYQVAMYSCTTTLCTQQIVLYETTNVIDDFIQTKGLCGWNGGNGIEALNNATGTAATVQAGRNYPVQWTTTNDGKRYTPSGAVNYTVSWYQGATAVPSTVNAATGTVTATVCPTNTTTYTLQATYTNCNNTTQTVSDQMIVNVNQLTTSAGPDQSICSGGCTNLTCTAAGATSFSWVTIPGNTNVGNTATINVCPVATTTYVCTATSPTCSGMDTVVVNVSAMTTASAGPDDSVCVNSCTNLQGSGGVSYAWSPAGSISGPSNVANPLACPTVTTIYTVTVTDAAGCIGTDQTTVYVAPTALSVNITPTNATCFGSCNGQAQANPSGGYPPYTYSWSNGSLTSSANNLCAGNVSVTVTDAIGCTATANVNITEPTAVQIVTTNITTANCGQNDGSVTISISGGTPFAGNVYTILWPASGGTGLTENNLPPGQVCVYAYDQNGCGDTLCVNVPNTPGAGVNILSVTQVSCFNACDAVAVAGGVGGTQPYNFSWNTIPVAQTNDTATALCPGNYVVTMTDSNGCSDTAHVTITQPLILTSAASGATNICIGQSATLNDVAAGGTPAYSYFWTDGTTNWNTASITVSPTVTTTYSVIVTDAHGCTSPVQTVVVTVNAPLVVTPSNNVTVCAGTQVNLSANGTGGDGNYSYVWNPGNLNGPNVTVTVNSTTTYTVTLTDGCNSPADTGTVTVTINPAPVVNIAATSPTQGCQPLCVTFANNTPNSASVEWVFGNNQGTSNLANPTFCFPTAGTYDVTATVTDNIGCVGTTTLSNYVTVYPLPDANFSASPQPATILNNIVSFTDLSTGGPVSWIWSFGSNDSASVLQNPTYAFPDSGYYDVQLIITNQYGCQDSVTIPVIVQEDFALYIPNTFTPNSDGINDLFYPQGMGVNPDKYEMMIFDRWGNLLFKTDKWMTGWDGTVQGTSRVCQQDTYVFKIVVSGPDGGRHQYVGHINLIR